MGYANKEVPDYWSGLSLAADKNGDAIDVRNQSSGSIALKWAGATATDAVVKLQQSVDGSDWFDISGKTKTIGAASGTNLFELKRDEMPGACYVRAVLTKNSETTGTATLKAFFKGDR